MYLLGAIMIIIWFLVIKPLIPMLYLKVKFGKTVYFDYFPIIGYFNIFIKSLRKYND